IKNYTFNMIDGMYPALGFKEKMLKKEKMEKIVEEITNNNEKIINKLPKEALEELKFIYGKGGIVRYSTLKLKYGDERNIFWNEDLPKSPTGILKLYDLIVVGTFIAIFQNLITIFKIIYFIFSISSLTIGSG
ncbi:MAG: hypothetical protein ACP5MB_11585, partial [bacterium]